MNRFLLAISVGCLALSGMAANPRQQQRHAAGRLSFDRNVELKVNDRLNYRHKDGMKKAPAKINTPEDIITSADGVRHDMTLKGSGFFVSWDLEEYENQEFSNHVVYGDNDEVYIYNIIPYLPSESYVKGTKEGDKVVVPLPQTVLWDDKYEDGVNVYICDFIEYEEDGVLYYDYMPVEGESLVLSLSEDGSMKADGLDFEHMLGAAYCSDDTWAGFGVWDLSMKSFSGSVVTVPSDLEVAENLWSYKCQSIGYGWPVNFAQGGEEIYFQGLSEMMPEAWVKATVEYDDDVAHVYIDQNQLVGTYGGAYIYTKCAETVTFEMFGNVYESYELMPEDYRLELIWDYEAETMTLKDPNVTLLFNQSQEEVDYVDELYGFVLAIQDSYEGTPANPYDLKYYDMWELFNYCVFEFALPGLSADGDLLDTSALSYVVYVDGEEWSFDPVDYGIEEPMELIPWSFKSPYIMKWVGSCKHAVYFFAEGISTFGVQSVYNYDGVETRSEIMTLDLETTAVDGVEAGRKMTDVKYFDLSGREVASPAEGIFVKRVTFDDGSVATFKQAIR